MYYKQRGQDIKIRDLNTELKEFKKENGAWRDKHTDESMSLHVNLTSIETKLDNLIERIDRMESN